MNSVLGFWHNFWESGSALIDVEFVLRSHYNSLQVVENNLSPGLPQEEGMVGSSVQFDQEQSQFGEGAPVFSQLIFVALMYTLKFSALYPTCKYNQSQSMSVLI